MGLPGTSSSRAAPDSAVETGAGEAPRDACSVAEAESIRRLLKQAVAATLSTWPERSSFWRASEVEEPMQRVAQTILERAVDPEGFDESRATARETDQLLTRRLLEALRVQVLRAWATGEGEPSSPALRVLVAIEELRSSFLHVSNRELAQRLSEPDGFELLVEVAHDLRSPLTSISFLTETLRAGHSGDVNDLQRSQLGLIWSAAFGMISVVTDVVDLARGGGYLFDDEPAPFSIRTLLEGVREVVGPMVEEKGIEVRLSVPAHDRVQGNRMAIFRVLLNLTTNAVKFTDSGYVELTAESVDRDVVRFSVRDTGRGIPAEAEATLYDAFKKANRRRGYFFSGSGLGLSIARRIVEMLDSELVLDTRPDWGTRFSFDLDLPAAGHL